VSVNSQIKTLKEKRAGLLDKADGIVTDAERRGRDMSSDEAARVKALMREADGIKDELDNLLAVEKKEMNAVTGGTGGTTYSMPGGRELRAYGPGESIARGRPNTLPDGLQPEDLSIGRAIRAAVTGDWRHAEAEARVMATSPGPSGGYLVPAELSATWFDLARPISAVSRAGAKTAEMDAKTVSFAKVSADPDHAWKQENAAMDASDVTLAEVVLTAKTLYIGPVILSRELLQDSINGSQLIEQVMARALAQELDRASLLGGGTYGPTGLVDTDGVGEITGVGEIEDYSDFVLAHTALMEENVEAGALSLLMPPYVAGELDGLTDTLGQPLNPPRSFEDIQRKIVTTQLTDDLAVMGDFNEMVIGTRLGATIEVSETALEAFESYEHAVRGVLRADVAVVRPSSFVVLSEVTGYES
jgi:HK97 family phage major capsid protein